MQLARFIVRKCTRSLPGAIAKTVAEWRALNPPVAHGHVIDPPVPLKPTHLFETSDV
ncbi:protein of unknown function (plasmid) [Cupriavidus taiwanensis]|nr:protein of unknown function [Cupriavidus taiwanensis]